MGVPLKSYEGFKSLIDPDSSNHQYFRQEANNFTLFALIVHDPALHSEFDRTININFEFFDRITGDDFVFFVLTKPSENWFNRRSNREYYTNINRDTLDNNTKLDTYGLCNYFDIDYSELPVIILSNSLTFNGFVTVKTNENIIESQFNRISRFCYDKHGFFNMFEDEDFRSLINEIKQEETDFYINRATSIAEGMVDLFSTTNEEQKLVAMNALSNKVFEKVNQLRQTKNAEFDSRIEQLILFIATRFATLNSSANHHALQLLDGLEHESQVLLETLNAIYPIFLNTKSELEFSAGIIPLTKIFEIEINLSFVQYIRYLLSIEMPKYFNKPDRTKRNVYFPTREFPTELDVSVNVNSYTNNKFQPPELGKTRLALMVLAENNRLPKEFNKAKIQTLLTHWEKIRLIRNNVAHTGVLQSNDLNEIIEIFSLMQRQGILGEIIKLKESLKINPNGL
jgi:hypothetical protein